MSRLFPDRARAQLGTFARLAETDAGDVRWRSLATASTGGEAASRRERQASPTLEGGAAPV